MIPSEINTLVVIGNTTKHVVIERIAAYRARSKYYYFDRNRDASSVMGTMIRNPAHFKYVHRVRSDYGN